MPTKSSLPDIEIPAVDLWAFIFERKDREFSDEQGKHAVIILAWQTFNPPW